MIKFLEIVGIAIVAMIPVSVIIYVLSRIQAKGWIDSIEYYFKTKSKLNNHEQTKKK